MRIGILGAGMIGATAAKLFVRVGHEVAISNSRGPDTLRELASELAPKGKAMKADEAARWAEVVLLAVPWRSPEALPPVEAVQGKIVIDAMNPYASDGTVIDLGSTTSSEETRTRLPGARIVKAFNTIWYKHLSELGRTDLPVEDRHAIFVAGDDQEAKRVVMRLIEEIGFGGVDTGSIAESGRQEPNAPLYNRAMTVREGRELLKTAELR